MGMMSVVTMTTWVWLPHFFKVRFLCNIRSLWIFIYLFLSTIIAYYRPGCN